LLPAFGAVAVHEDVPVGPDTSVGQVVVTQPLAEVAALGVQEATGTLAVLFAVQVVPIQLLAALAAEGEQV
jgi:hypothetical protein